MKRLLGCRRWLVGAGLALLALVAPPWLRAQPAPAPAPAALEALVDLTANNLTVAQAVAQVADQLGWQVDTSAVPVPEAPVRLLLRNVRVGFALNQILAPHGLGYRLEGTVLRLTSVEQGTPTGSTAAAGDVDAGPLSAQLRPLLVAAVTAEADAAAQNALGWALRKARPDWRESFLTAVPRLVAMVSAEPAASLRAAQVLGRLGHTRTATILAERAADDPQQRAPALLALAAMALDEGRAPEAAAYLRRLGAEANGRAEPAALAARARYLGGEREMALVDATLVASRWPDNAVVQATYADLLRRASNHGAASLAAQTALRLQPGQPDATFVEAALAAEEGGPGGSAWRLFVRDEPFSLRAAQVQLAGSVVGSAGLASRGGRIWDVNSDGSLVLFSDDFRDQLQATDVAGSGLAAQLTDQESSKSWASWSPDGGWLAWSADGQTWLQRSGASGAQRAVYSAPAGWQGGRSTWLPDGSALIISLQTPEADGPPGRRRGRPMIWQDATGAPVQPGQLGGSEANPGFSALHAISPSSGEELPLPTHLQLVGLTQVRCLPDGAAIGVLSVVGSEAVVLVAADQPLRLLRPWAPLGTYRAPDLDARGARVLWYEPARGQLLAALADGSDGGAVPLLNAPPEAAGARWIPGQNAVLVTAATRSPQRFDLDGLPLPTAVRCWLPEGQSVLRWDSEDAEAHATVTLVDLPGDEHQLAQGPLVAGLEVSVQPLGVGEHWLRLDVRRGEVDETPRWYRYTVVSPAA